jgi:hypothetical protein
MAATFHFFIFLSRVHQEEYVGVAASGCISHFTSCSVVFMIMRFPLRVVAIGGVEAGSGKGGWHVLVFLRDLNLLLHLACSSVVSVFCSGVS